MLYGRRYQLDALFCSNVTLVSNLSFIPVLAQNESRTLYYRETKCFFRGLEILMGTNHCTRMSELGYDT